MLNERENILSALREKPLKVYEIMKRANISNEEACQSLLLKMRDDGLVKFDEHTRDVPVQRPQHPDPSVHQEVPALSGLDKDPAGGLPFLKLLLGPRQLRDVIGSVFEREQLAPVDRVVEWPGPVHGIFATNRFYLWFSHASFDPAVWSG